MTNINRICPLALSAASLLALASAAHAAPTAAQIGLADGSVRDVLIRGSAPAVGPRVVFGSPTAFGLGWGDVAIGGGGTYEPNPRNGQEYNGSLAMSFGLGDAQKAVAVEITGGVDRFEESTTNSNNDDVQGSFSAKLHTALPGSAALAFGVDNFGSFGEGSKRNAPTSVYVAGTKYYQLNPNGNFKYPVGVTAGFGNGRFLKDRGSNDQASVFGSLEFILSPLSSVTADWQGRDLNLTAAVAPLAKVPVVFSVGGSNLTRQNNNRAAYVANIGYQFKL